MPLGCFVALCAVLTTLLVRASGHESTLGGTSSPLPKSETAEKSATGVVLIFDSEDGGMVAATRAVLDLWKNGSLSEQAFWRQCYLDPPEILGTAN